MTPPAAADPGRDVALPDYFHRVDALRGIAALAVVIFHYHHFYLATYLSRDVLPDAAQFPYAALLEPLYRYGGNAVELFWVISGFVFAHVYLRRQTSLRDFWVARIARLYPLHVATLLIVATIQAVNWSAFGTWQIYGNNDLRHFALQLVLATNVTNLSRGLSFNGPIWSVSVEMVAYATFFLSLGLLRRAGLVAAIALCAAAAWLSHADWFDPPLLNVSALVCVAYFFCGTITYLIFQRCRGRLYATGAMLAVLTMVVAAFVATGLRAPGIAGISAGLIVVAAALDGRGPGSIRLFRSLGDMSYSLYLVHVPLQMLFLTGTDFVAPGQRGFATSLWLLPVYLCITCIVAWIVHRRYEVPAGRALRQWGQARVPASR